jgi:AcrR family transcriptional regulator
VKPAKDDRRVARTRRNLRESLVTLILERGWDAVSVQDVCGHADVGRSTFYVHFADKEELLLSGFDELHAALDGLRSSERGPFSFARNLIEHAQANQRLFSAVVGKRSGVAVQRRFRDVVALLTDAELTALGLPAVRRGWATRYISGGFIELLLHWLERPGRTEAATLAETFLAFTRGVLAGA